MSECEQVYFWNVKQYQYLSEWSDWSHLGLVNDLELPLYYIIVVIIYLPQFLNLFAQEPKDC